MELVSPEDSPGYVAHIRSGFTDALYREHFLVRLRQRSIKLATIREAVFSASAEVFERYPDDPYGDCCTLLGRCQDGQPLHIRVSLGNPPYIITVYDPSVDPKNRWEPDLKTRRRPPPAGEVQ